MIVKRMCEPRTDSETLNRRFAETTNANERMGLLREMCALIQMAHLVLKCQFSELWH